MRRAVRLVGRRIAAGLAATTLGLVLVLAIAAGSARPATAQSAPLTEIDDETEVRALRFRFTDTQTFTSGELREQIALTARPALYGVRRVLGFLPLIPDVGVYPFAPIDLARDAIRLKRFYERNGFLFAEVDWLVRLDAERNVVTVLFTITEGPPLIIESLDYVMPGGMLAREQLAPELRPEWEQFKAETGLRLGERLDEFEIIRLRDEALRWVRNRGYPFSRVTSRTAVDTLASQAAVTIIVDTGPRARIGEIVLEGNERVRDGAILRELPLRPGDLFVQRRLVEGQRQIFELDIIQLALVDVPEQPVDTTVTIRVRVRERPPRGVTGQAGYLTESGLTGRADWTHRNFLGDARTLRASAIANTGWIAAVANPETRYRGNLSLRQPYVFNRHLSANGNVFAEWRDDYRDNSRAFGADATLLYERGQFRNASLTYSFEDRLVFRFGLGGGADELLVGFIEEELNVDPGEVTNLSRSFVAANATYGQVDNPIDPRSGFVVRPTAQITLPLPGTALRYARMGITGTGYVPLGDRITFAGRANVGRLFPFADVGEVPGNAFTELLRLRDVVFLAGGTNDVRGWGPGQVGPKVLDLVSVTEVTPEDPTDPNSPELQRVTELIADRYFNFGGTARATATAEGRYRLSDTFGVFGFADAGRIWTPEPDYQVPPGSPLFDRTYGETERIFAGVGGGVSVASPIGAIRLSLAMKVNPSFFDLRNPADIAEAFEEIAVARLGPLTGWTHEDLHADIRAFPEVYMEAANGVSPSLWRRFRLHLSVGQIF
jgi:outer membrane protein insertion porin family